MTTNTYTFNFANLTEKQAVEQIVAQENLDFGRQYNFDLCCKDGFKAIFITVDKDGNWSYSSSEIKFPESDGEAKLAFVEEHLPDGSITSYYKIVPERELSAMRAMAGYTKDNIEATVSWFDVTDVLAGW